MVMNSHLQICVAACLAALSAGPAHAQNITSENWGATDRGERVELFTLKGAHGLQARITNFGGRVVNLYVPNREGSMTDVELGFDNFAAYFRKDNIYGALVGRYVGRISHGGSFALKEKHISLKRPGRRKNSSFTAVRLRFRTNYGRRRCGTAKSPLSR